MVSAVHPALFFWRSQEFLMASKGLHMVSAVHHDPWAMLAIRERASKGLHMVSAVHL